MTVVVQSDGSVRVHRSGGEKYRASEQHDGAAPTSATIPQPTARSAPTAREITRNNRARLYQLSQGFCRMRLLRSAFRAIARARDALDDVSSSLARAEGASPPSLQVPFATGLSESTNSDASGGALPAAGASPGSKRAAPLSGATLPSPPHPRLVQRARGDGPSAGLGETAMMNVCASPFTMPPPTSPPPPIPTLLPICPARAPAWCRPPPMNETPSAATLQRMAGRLSVLAGPSRWHGAGVFE